MREECVMPRRERYELIFADPVASDPDAEDIVIHIPGRSGFAGDHRGKSATVGYIEAIRDHYRDGKIELELLDMLTSDERVALLVLERFHGDGPPVEIRRANVYRVRGDRIVEVSIFEADQYVVDELLHVERR